MIVVALDVLLPPLLVGWHTAMSLDSGLLGLAAAFMTLLFGVALLGAMKLGAGNRR